jgi:hypothetical protein
LNYEKFSNSCLPLKFAVLKDFLDVIVDGWHLDIVKRLFLLILSPPAGLL